MSNGKVTVSGGRTVKPTSRLRWLKGLDGVRLQQAWRVFDDTNVEVEWRDIPTEFEEHA